MTQISTRFIFAYDTHFTIIQEQNKRLDEFRTVLRSQFWAGKNGLFEGGGGQKI